MPIHLPRSPQYQSRVRPRSSLGLGSLDLRGVFAQGQAITNLGKVITQRADQLKEQRDASVVGDLYNQWRDQDREKLSELLQRKGRFAKDLGQFYDGAFNKSLGDFDEQTENGNQQRMLTELLNRKRENNLDILARYEAQEGQRYQAQVQAGVIANAEKDVRSFGVNDLAKVEQTIAETIEFVRAANPGKDTTAAEQTIRSSLLFANTQSLIDQDPEVALAVLEDRKEELGEGYLTLKKDAKAQVKQKTIDGVQAELQLKYEANGVADFEKMRQDLTHKKIAPDIKFEVRQWLDSYEAQQKNSKIVGDAKAHDAEERAIGMAFLEKDYATVRNLLRKSQFLDGDELRTWSNAIDSNQKADPIKIDAQKRSREVVTINSMISRGVDRSKIEQYIMLTPHLKPEEKTVRIDALNRKLETELNAGMKEGKKLIQSLIIPKRGQQAKFLQHPLETDRVSQAQDALDDWLDSETKNNRRPSKGEIKQKARELSVDFKPSVAELIDAKRQSLERDRAAFKELE